MIFLLKLEWKRRGNCPNSDLKASRYDVMEAEDKEDMPYNQQYLVDTSKRRKEYLFPP